MLPLKPHQVRPVLHQMSLNLKPKKLSCQF